MSRNRSRQWLRGALRNAAVVLVATAVVAPPFLPGVVAVDPPAEARTTSWAPASAPTYTNPVSDSAVADLPDPSVIRGKDGAWYAYGSTDAVRADVGDTSRHWFPILTSTDMVHWRYVRDVFTQDTLPQWLRGKIDAGGLWAPDIRYIDGKYHLYYSATNAGKGFFTVGLATAPTPTGPWTDSGGPVIPPKGTCDTFTDIDPAQYDGLDGRHYLLWGSFTHLCVMRLNADATRTVGDLHTVYAGDGEGAYVTEHDGYYYLFVSENDCCKGIYSSYQVRVGRSKSPTGPFVDSRGIAMTDPQSHGSFVLASNGNRWVAPGGLGVATDLSGQSWMAYHAIARDRTAPPGINPDTYRPMLIDRLDWHDGWPTVRGGAWASETPQTAPVTTFDAGGAFHADRPLSADWDAEGPARGAWRLEPDEQAGTAVTASSHSRRPSLLVSRENAPAEQRAEADLRLADGAAGLVVGYRSAANYAVAWLDSEAQTLVTEVVTGGRAAGARRTPLPASFNARTWHNVAAEIRDDRLVVQVTNARQADPVAMQSRDLPATFRSDGAVGVAASRGRMFAANVGAARLHTAGTLAPSPATGGLDTTYSDEFTAPGIPGTAPGSPWRWVRGPRGTSTGDTFDLPTEGDLWADGNTAPLLLRTAPPGDYTVETKLDFDGTVPHQQAGLVVYVDDDHWIRLDNGVTNATEPGGPFRREIEFAHEDGWQQHCTCWMDAGPTAPTMWLRLVHRTDPRSGIPTWQAQSSRDGKAWVTAGTWWLPKDSQPEIGVASMNAPGATAKFDYFRVYRP